MRTKTTLTIATLAAFIAAGAVDASAQSLNDLAAANIAYANQQNAWLQAQMNQMTQAHNASVGNYVAQNRERLEEDYRRSGMTMPWDQFIQWHISTAGGTNYGAALEAQQKQFEGLQAANRTMQQGFDSYNSGYWHNQQTMDKVFGRYSREAIGGNAVYHNPITGEAFDLPYGGSGVYTQGHNTFAGDNVGNWNQVDGLGFQQQLDLEFDR